MRRVVIEVLNHRCMEAPSVPAVVDPTTVSPVIVLGVWSRYTVASPKTVDRCGAAAAAAATTAAATTTAAAAVGDDTMLFLLHKRVVIDEALLFQLHEYIEPINPTAIVTASVIGDVKTVVLPVGAPHRG